MTVLLILFLLPAILFLLVMKFKPVSLLSGFTLQIWMGICAVLAVVLLGVYVPAVFSAGQSVPYWLEILAALILFLALLSILFLPLLLDVFLIIEGIKLIRKEGLRFSNMLTLLLGLGILFSAVSAPFVLSHISNSISALIYLGFLMAAFYFLELMAVYALSTRANVIHFTKRKNLDYIVVLGCGIIGKKMTPLLKGRVNRGIEILKENPDAVMILSGGQGPGEEIAEASAMYQYALRKGVQAKRMLIENRSLNTFENICFSRLLMDKEDPKIAIVSTNYHVFRALLLAENQGLDAVGYGSKTKWYFELNALIREFIGYLSLTWKRQAMIMLILAASMMLIAFMAML